MAAKVTLREIAQEVGLSTTAVSLVLNDRPCRISDENKRRIKEVARRQGYVPNQIARSLVTRHSHTLGLIVPNIESRFFSSLARTLELRCRARGYALLITNSDDSAPNDPELVRLLANRGIDGLFIVVSDELSADEELAPTLAQLPMPCVMVDRTLEAARCDKVRFNGELGGYLACRELLDHGHRRIACIINTDSNTGLERLAGYERALTEAGIEPDPALEFTSHYYTSEAYVVAERLLTTDATAVFASSDNIALGLLKRLYENNLRVPRDFSVVGYDNSAADQLFEPALTTVEQNVDELAGCAFDLMVERLAAEEESRPKPEERVLEPRLVVKQSVRDL